MIILPCLEFLINSSYLGYVFLLLVVFSFVYPFIRRLLWT